MLIGAIVLYSSFIKTEYQHVQQLRAMLIAKTNLFDEQKSIIERVKALLAEYKGTAQLQDTISLALPADESVAALFQQLFAISQSSGVQMNSLGLSQDTIRPNGLGAIKLNLLAKGSYESFKAFLRLIETNIRVMDLSKLTIQKDTYNFDITTYYQK